MAVIEKGIEERLEVKEDPMKVRITKSRETKTLPKIIKTTEHIILIQTINPKDLNRRIRKAMLKKVMMDMVKEAMKEIAVEVAEAKIKVKVGADKCIRMNETTNKEMLMTRTVKIIEKLRELAKAEEVKEVLIRDIKTIVSKAKILVNILKSVSIKRKLFN